MSVIWFSPCVSVSTSDFYIGLTVFFSPQPGKLAEAFKYFVQGMGYSEYCLMFLSLLVKLKMKKNVSSFLEKFVFINTFTWILLF